MIRVVSLFSGCGGADMGLYRAATELGVDARVVAAYDSWPKAVEIYNRNLPHAVARVADIKRLTPEDLPPHDLVIGGPPCQSHSLAGRKECRCHLGGPASPRCCLADFMRLVGNGPYLMENVVPRLIPNVPFSIQLNAFDFGDVTTRKRWFYSSHLLYVIPTPGPRRFGDIRDHEADRVAIGRRKQLENVSTCADVDALSSLTAHAWHGHDLRSNVKLVGVPQVITHRPREDGSRNGKYVTPIENDGVFQSLTHDAPHAFSQGELPIDTRILKVGLRGHSASASAFDDDKPIGSLVANSWHGNEIGRLGRSVRCPSLLEMQRAHSFPDDFDWRGATKTDRGIMIANSWPISLATAVCKAMLVALGAGQRDAESDVA
jgi:site-specific DNA-cytosine methylase